MGYRKDARNGTLNTVSTVGRVPYSAINGIVDIWRTWLYNVLNFWTRLWDRAKDIKTAIHNATHTWSNWKKLRRVPASLVTWAGSILTWLFRDAAATWRDIVWDLFQVFWNAFNNAWSAIKRIWKKEPVWNFSFAKIQQSDPKMPSILPTWFKAA